MAHGYILPPVRITLHLSGADRQELLARKFNQLIEQACEVHQHHFPTCLELSIAGPKSPEAWFQKQRGRRFRLDIALQAHWTLPNGLVYGDRHLPMSLVNTRGELMARGLRTKTHRTEVNKLFPL